ncbi:hypothetical protein SDC9_181817 [bioreactor metagenome]|uniref:Uncharacterized protein n=1 Tax=bioreactor metagenome TaxID=1076179 RepID=A0A645HDZ7_9ZZZZ
MANGPLKGGPGGGIFQWLLVLAFFGQVGDPGLDRVIGSRSQLHAGLNDDIPAGFYPGGPVAQFQLIPGQHLLLPLRGDDGDGFQNMAHLPVIGTGVHKDGAAQGSRDAAGKLQSGQVMSQGQIG